jgi:hypothetical protein
VSSLSSKNYGAVALQAKDGRTIYFFGGWPYKPAVDKFDSVTNVTVLLSTVLPSTFLNAGGASINGTILLFDGYNGNVLEFSEETELVRIVADLSFNNADPVSSVTALPDNKDGIWLFAGNYGKPTYLILQFNTTAKSVHVPNADTTTLFSNPALVKDCSHGYLIGGIGGYPEEDGIYHPSNGLLR